LEGDVKPVFRPTACGICHQIIRASYFRCKIPKECKFCRKSGKSAGPICQDCQHAGLHPEANLTKHHKHCVLSPENIDHDTGRSICQCTNVERFDVDGEPRTLFPVDKKDAHRDGPVSCGLLSVVGAVAEAKYEGVLIPIDSKVRTLEEQKQLAKDAEKKRRAEEQRKNLAWGG
jgi:hypothetical protein